MFWRKKKKPDNVVIDDIIAKPLPEVLSAPKLKSTECSFCKAVYQAEPHHLKSGMFSLGVRRVTECPVCRTENLAEFEERNDENGTI